MAVLIQMVAAAVLSPVNHIAIAQLCGFALCFGKVLSRGGVIVDGSGTGDQQGDSRDHGYDFLGFLVQILVPKQDNNERHKGDNSHDKAHLAAQEEPDFVLFGRRIDSVCLLPEQGTYDNKQQVNAKADNDEGLDIQLGQPIQIAVKTQNDDHFCRNSKQPEEYGQQTLAGGALFAGLLVAAILNFHYFTLFSLCFPGGSLGLLGFLLGGGGFYYLALDFLCHSQISPFNLYPFIPYKINVN